MNKDAYYFPHFSNARNDSKILKLRRVMGIEGYGMYFLLLEVLRDQTDFKMSLESLEDLAYEWHTSKEKLASVVANFELFQIDNNNFFSPKFNEYLQPYLEGKKNKKIAGIKGNLIRYKHLTKEEVSKMSDSEILDFEENRKHSESNALAVREKNLAMGELSESVTTRTASQRKGKESKVKESKVKESKVKERFSFLFSHDEFEQSFNDFVEMRKSIKAVMTERAKELLLIKLCDLSKKDVQISINILNQSTLNNWKGIFQLKNDSEKLYNYGKSNNSTGNKNDELIKALEEW
jgi:hypothetical protein